MDAIEKLMERLAELPQDQFNRAVWATLGAATFHACHSPRTGIGKVFALIGAHVKAAEWRLGKDSSVPSVSGEAGSVASVAKPNFPS